MNSNEHLPVKYLILGISGFLIYLFFVPALLFILAGTLKWTMAWIYAILTLLASILSRIIVFRKNPDTLLERAKFTSSENTKSWDRIIVIIIGFLGPLTIVIIAGLDYRHRWSIPIPLYIRYVSALIMALSYTFSVWAMVVNRYFSSVARVQKDREQVVVKTGPYRIVRHPSYSSTLLASLALPFMLSSFWALIPASVIIVALIIRTYLEDKMLQSELEGYYNYIQETPFRLIPGLW